MRLRSAEEALARMGVTDPVLKGVGAVAVLTASLEFWTERAIWTLNGIAPAGTRPITDGKPIKALIEQVREAAGAAPDTPLAPVLSLWCGVAETAMRCRNSLVHGLPYVPYGDGVVFGKNLPWDGVVRKRDYSDFHADENTLRLLSDALAVLVLVVAYVASPGQTKDPQRTLDTMTAELCAARSVVNELVDLSAAVNHEKY